MLDRGRGTRGSFRGAGAGAWALWCRCRGTARTGCGRDLGGAAAWAGRGSVRPAPRCRRFPGTVCGGVVSSPLCIFECRFAFRLTDATSTTRSCDGPRVGSTNGDGRAGATVRPPGARPGPCSGPPAGRDMQLLVARRTAAAAARRRKRGRTHSRCRRGGACPNDAPGVHADEGQNRTLVGLLSWRGRGRTSEERSCRSALPRFTPPRRCASAPRPRSARPARTTVCGAGQAERAPAAPSGRPPPPTGLPEGDVRR